MAQRKLGLRDLTLGELDSDGLLVLLAESETLFVEHKTAESGKGEGFQLAKPAAAFANTLGGWILLGVGPDGRPTGTWEPRGASVVDDVRQQLDGLIDPMPPIAATEREVNGARIGVVRVYESADTPHLVRGTVYVREPAQDRRASKDSSRYQANPVSSHYELAQLVKRGEQAQAEAARRVAQTGGAGEFCHLGMGQMGIVLRVTPLTLTERWRSWAVTGAPDLVAAELRELVGSSGRAQVAPAARGCRAQGTGATVQWTRISDLQAVHVPAIAVDSDGILGVRHGYYLRRGQEGGESRRPIGDGVELRAFFERPLEIVSRLLSSADLIGRYRIAGSAFQLGDLFAEDPDYAPEHQLATRHDLDGELVIDGSGHRDSDPQTSELAAKWVRELRRASGTSVWG